MAQLDKPIIHFQIPHDEKGDPTSEFSYVSLFNQWAKQELGDKAYILTTPYDIDVIGAEVEKVKLDEMTLAEFLKKNDIRDGTEE